MSEKTNEQAVPNWREEASWAPGRTLEVIKRACILKTLEHNKGNKMRTARELGISVKGLRYMLARWRELGITIPGILALVALCALPGCSEEPNADGVRLTVLEHRLSDQHDRIDEIEERSRRLEHAVASHAYALHALLRESEFRGDPAEMPSTKDAPYVYRYPSGPSGSSGTQTAELSGERDL